MCVFKRSITWHKTGPKHFYHPKSMQPATSDLILIGLVQSSFWSFSVVWTGPSNIKQDQTGLNHWLPVACFQDGKTDLNRTSCIITGYSHDTSLNSVSKSSCSNQKKTDWNRFFWNQQLQFSLSKTVKPNKTEPKKPSFNQFEQLQCTPCKYT